MSKSTKHPDPIPSTPRDAGAPFNDNTADVILRSSDNVDFHVHKVILSLASPFFREMFSIPQSTSGSEFSMVSQEAERLPVVDVTEDARTLETILRCCYPVEWPTVNKLSDVRLVLEAAQKYDLDAAYKLAVTSLKSCIDQDVLGVFAIACRCKRSDICVAAAGHFLQHKFITLDSEELEHIPASQYHKLLQYHQRCAAAASAVVKSRTWFVGIDPDSISDRKQAHLCSSCSVQNPGSNWHASPEVWKYLERAGEALRDRPQSSIPLLEEVLEPWLSQPCPNRCSDAAIDGYGRRKTQNSGSCACVTKDKLSKALAKEVDRVLKQIEIPSFC